VIVALAHMNSAQINKLLDRVKGIDIVVGGHDYMRRANSANPDNVMVVQTGTKGQYIGDIKLNIDETKKVVSNDGRIMTLSKNIKDDPAISKIVQEYRRESNKQRSPNTGQ
jgi:2',3'-cyclic-nucleotide 2'-phosphodiesterase (5'-nucleotidase family)